uniref:Pr6Pr family membrane protein n=1 Tax=mine drainage metagenome TaxID=410659 RepID=E6QWS0_9ZZZZ
MTQVHNVSRIALALVTGAAILVQLSYSLTVLHASVWNFFSFFTILTNIIVVIALLAPQVHLLRGAATLYIVIVGIFFALLLSGVEGAVDSTIPWVNFVLHDLTPIALVADWLIDPKPLRGTYLGIVAIWSIYPVVYLAYSLVRGAIIGWYPYPFLNPANGGYTQVAMISVAITISTIILGVALIAYGRYRTSLAR